MSGNIALLVAAGALLFFAEMWLPGLVAGVAGAIAWIAALGLTYTHFGTGAGHLLLVSMVIGGTCLFTWWMRVFPATRLGRKWILEAEVKTPAAAGGDGSIVIGDEGVALTPLRPAGAARVRGRRVDVTTDGEWTDPQTAVRVVRIEGTKIVVRARSNAA
jgi:membrane-bound serine protease (ClpP class)